MKRAVLAAAFAALACAGPALAQSTPPQLPKLDARQAADVDQKLSLYRSEIEGRVARGEITAAEADRLIAWRHWQLAQAAAGLAPAADAPPGDVPPGAISDAPPRVVQQYQYPQYPQYYYAPPPVYYAPPAYYPAPAYYGPWYWGPRVCAGGFGRHFGGRVCF